ncbi:hypothetical protein T4A_7048, partial [Trichinella pseudospiralis]
LIHAKNRRRRRDPTLVTNVTLFTIGHDINTAESNNNQDDLELLECYVHAGGRGGTVLTCMPAHHVVTIAKKNMNQPSLPTPVVDYATPSESRSNLTIGVNLYRQNNGWKQRFESP